MKVEAPAVPAMRLRLALRGVVQGVGFRPFVHRLATELGLAGWVNNSAQGVTIEIEGDGAQVERFRSRLELEKPALASIHGAESVVLEPRGGSFFEIRESERAGRPTALVLPDIALCNDCRRELFDPANRRYRYPLINCTNCGPRFSIVQALPYDRPNTTMRAFEMCAECRKEYEDPDDRRFHAQPNACPHCGPHLEFWSRNGRVRARHDDALNLAAAAVRLGKIVAVKGLGGFHLIADACDDPVVQKLRRRKHRDEKPFALMYPSLDLIGHDCEILESERRLLCAPEAPIVLLRRRDTSEIATSVAPGNPRLGVMLPYTPLHHLLMEELRCPVVATSGNLSDEPICIDEREALKRLDGIADFFLVHNRPIARHVDDSVVRIMAGRQQVVRRARGFAPLPVGVPSVASPVLGVGAHLKNTVALGFEGQVFVSQHIGDLETAGACAAFTRVVEDFERLYQTRPAQIACDAHPDYRSTIFARGTGVPVRTVQHHVAHVAACMAENEISGPALGVSWDGTGYGTDGTIWGGEFLRVDCGSANWERIAHFQTFPLPGGEAAVKEPRRAAIGLLYAAHGDAAFNFINLPPLRSFGENERKTLQAMLTGGVNCPLTSSVGRLFDAVAALVGIRQKSNFEGQAAMELEFVAGGFRTDDFYAFAIDGADGCGKVPLQVDWRPMLRGILEDIATAVSHEEIAAKFHNTLVSVILEVAKLSGESKVVLTGGCFQNATLTERAVARLSCDGFRPFWHQRIPPNDGGIALGQVVMACNARTTGGD